jgi:hypothetical protein
VPEAYEFKIFGLTFSDKIWAYATAAQVSQPLPDIFTVPPLLSCELTIVYRAAIISLATALQLALGNPPATLLLAACGLASGSIYRSDILQLKGWRIPQK